MPEEKWYQNPEKASQAAAVIILALAALLTWLFAGEEVKKMFALAVSGDVEALAAYFRSFGAWAMLISFLLDVLINAGSIFPSIFISTANGLIFGLFSVRNFNGDWRGKQNFHARLHYCQPYRQISFNGAGGCYRTRYC